MKIYGRFKDHDSKLRDLVEASLVAEPSTLRDLASFLYRCADAIEEQGSEWEQEYFESNDVIGPDIIVYNPSLVDS